MLTLQADEIKSQIDQEIKNFEQTLTQVHKTQQSESEFDEDGALQINESLNEFDVEQQTSDVKAQLESVFD